jgi:hypothetical protein
MSSANQGGIGVDPCELPARARSAAKQFPISREAGPEMKRYKRPFAHHGQALMCVFATALHSVVVRHRNRRQLQKDCCEHAKGRRSGPSQEALPDYARLRDGRDGAYTVVLCLF